ncbi:MAG: tetratricopeptide repeat protein [Myxococcota bacterium]
MSWTKLGILVALGLLLFAAFIIPSCEACVGPPSTKDLPEQDRAGADRMRERARQVEEARLEQASRSDSRSEGEETAHLNPMGSEVEKGAARLDELRLQLERFFEEPARDLPGAEPRSYAQSENDYHPAREEEPPPQVDEVAVEAWFEKFDAVDWLDPDSSERSLFYVANGAVRDEQYELAIPVLEELLRTEPGYGPAHALLGTSHANLGRKQEAEFHYQRFVDLSPDHPQAKDVIRILEDFDRWRRDEDR